MYLVPYYGDKVHMSLQQLHLNNDYLQKSEGGNMSGRIVYPLQLQNKILV